MLCGIKMGRHGFEPWKRERNRFTVCPLWPLGYLPVVALLQLYWRSATQSFFPVTQGKKDEKRNTTIAFASVVVNRSFLFYFSLGNLERSKRKSRREESNPRPAVYKTAALPTELRRHSIISIRPTKPTRNTWRIGAQQSNGAYISKRDNLCKEGMSFLILTEEPLPFKEYDTTIGAK